MECLLVRRLESLFPKYFHQSFSIATQKPSSVDKSLVFVAWRDFQGIANPILELLHSSSREELKGQRAPNLRGGRDNLEIHRGDVGFLSS